MNLALHPTYPTGGDLCVWLLKSILLPSNRKWVAGIISFYLRDLWKQPETKSNFATENQTWLQDEKCPFRAFGRLFSGVNSLFLFSGSCNLGGFNYFLCSS